MNILREQNIQNSKGRFPLSIKFQTTRPKKHKSRKSEDKMKFLRILAKYDRTSMLLALRLAINEYIRPLGRCNGN